MKKAIIVLATMFIGSMCFAQTIGKASGTSKPIPPKPKTPTRYERVFAISPKILEKEIVTEESE